MPVPPPHPDDISAAALDTLGAALVRVQTDPSTVWDVVVASQAVYTAGLRQVRQSVDAVAAQIDEATSHVEARLGQIDQRLGQLASRPGRGDLELHDLRNKIQGAMDAMIIMHENRDAIEKVYAQLQEVTARLTDEIKLREELAGQVQELMERAVGDQEPPS